MSLYKRCPHKGRQRDACEHVWWSQITHKHRTYYESLEQYFDRDVRGPGSKTLARELDQELGKQIRDGAYAAKQRAAADEAEKPAYTFTTFIPVYKQYYVDLAGLRSWDQDRKWKLAKIERALGDTLLTAITLDDITAFLVSLKAEQAKPSTIKRYHALFDQMFGWAARRKYIPVSPLAEDGIDLEKEDNQRSRRLSDEEETQLLTHADRYLKDAIVVALDTVLRQRSMLDIQIKFIDWRTGVVDGRVVRHSGLLRIPGALLKQKRGITIPLTSRVRKIFERRAEAIRMAAKRQTDDPEAYLFGNEIGERYSTPKPLTDRWYRAQIAAGLRVDADPEHGIAAVDPDLEWRDLRAEGASRLAEMGVPVDTIRRMLGHSSLAQTIRYLRARVANLDELVEAMETWMPTVNGRTIRDQTHSRTVINFGDRTRRSDKAGSDDESDV